ncbi:MAG: peptidyl-prolyl cis-trans isomerase B (cyclophilin B) [Paraglaciecola sp.]|jgi:peptidyl-prolyl cis-trans isomerase B (cyclophilin B)
MTQNSFPLLSRICVFTLVISALFISGCDLFEDKALVQINQFISQQTIDKNSPDWKTSLPKPPELEFSKGKRYLWELKTNKGNMIIELMPDVAPMHVSSTIYLTTLGFYDGIVFHRVISGFMAQGGDPLGTGRGDPGYKYAGEFSDNVKHTQPGLLSMANSGPNSDGSQFFLTFTATPWLDKKHTIFGQIVEGMEVLKTFESLGSRGGKTKEELKIVSAHILLK